MLIADEAKEPHDVAGFHAFGISAWTVTGDQEPVAREPHAQRAAAIRAVLVPRLAQLDIEWGLLDDPAPQRLVEVMVTVYPPFEMFGPGEDALIKSLSQAGAQSELAAVIAGLTRDLIFEQFRRRLGRFVLNLGNGARVVVMPGQQPHVRSARETGGAH
jgi:hypothetical protein